jgi:hypothetical protein
MTKAEKRQQLRSNIWLLFMARLRVYFATYPVALNPSDEQPDFYPRDDTPAVNGHITSDHFRVFTFTNAVRV